MLSQDIGLGSAIVSRARARFSLGKGMKQRNLAALSYLSRISFS